jgi:hypothetical protein
MPGALPLSHNDSKHVGRRIAGRQHVLSRFKSRIHDAIVDRLDVTQRSIRDEGRTGL